MKRRGLDAAAKLARQQRHIDDYYGTRRLTDAAGLAGWRCALKFCDETLDIVAVRCTHPELGTAYYEVTDDGMAHPVFGSICDERAAESLAQLLRPREAVALARHLVEVVR